VAPFHRAVNQIEGFRRIPLLDGQQEQCRDHEA
jgi:hypothetical protein